MCINKSSVKIAESISNRSIYQNNIRGKACFCLHFNGASYKPSSAFEGVVSKNRKTFFFCFASAFVNVDYLRAIALKNIPKLG